MFMLLLENKPGYWFIWGVNNLIVFHKDVIGSHLIIQDGTVNQHLCMGSGFLGF